MPTPLIRSFSQKKTEAHRTRTLGDIIFSSLVHNCFRLYSTDVSKVAKQGDLTGSPASFSFSVCAMRNYDTVVKQA